MKGLPLLALVAAGAAFYAVAPRAGSPNAGAAIESEEAESRGSLEYFAQLRAEPGKPIDYGKILFEYEKVYGGRGSRFKAQPDANEWTFIGPKNLDVPNPSNYYGSKPIVGRIMAIAVETGNDPAFFLGGANGGLWRGTHTIRWTPYSDQLFPYLMVGALAEGNGKVYLGTGDPHRCYNTEVRTLGTYGMFIYDKTAGTYSQTGKNEFGTLFAGDGTVSRPGGHVGAVALIPENPNIILAATGYGAPLAAGGSNPNNIWRFDGTNWTGVAGENRNFIDLAVGALSPATGRRYCYATATDSSSLFRSMNEGRTWTKLATPATQNGTDGILVAASPTDPNTVYLMSCPDKKIWRSRKAGGGVAADWVDITGDIPGIGGSTTASFFSFGFYNWSLECGTIKNPAGKDVDILVAGGTDLAVCHDQTNAKWTSIGKVNDAGGNLHTDQHALAFSPTNRNMLYVGCDGGVYRVTFTNVLTFTAENYMTRETTNSIFGVTQFYHVAVAGADHGTVLGGAQDNSAPFAAGAAGGANQAWKNIAPLGDAGWADINPGDSKIQVIGGYWDNTTGRVAGFMTKDTWANRKSMNNVFAGENAMFFPPFAADPSSVTDGGYAYTALEKLHYFKFSDGTWTKVSDTLLGSRVVSLAVSHKDWRYVYSGSLNGQVWLTKWKKGTELEYQRRINPTMAVNLPVTSISVDPENATRVLIGFGGSDRLNKGKRIYRCDNTTPAAGDPVWVDVHKAALPELPINAVAFYPGDSANEWWVVNDIGVFYTQDQGATYKVATKNLPSTIISDIRFVKGSAQVTVGTYGRGIWSAPRANLIGPQP